MSATLLTGQMYMERAGKDIKKKKNIFFTFFM